MSRLVVPTVHHSSYLRRFSLRSSAEGEEVRRWTVWTDEPTRRTVDGRGETWKQRLGPLRFPSHLSSWTGPASHRSLPPSFGTVSIPFRRPTAGPEGVTERRETARGREKIPREGEFTLRTDPWAGLIASIGSFYLMVYPLPLSARGSVVHPSLPLPLTLHSHPRSRGERSGSERSEKERNEPREMGCEGAEWEAVMTRRERSVRRRKGNIRPWNRFPVSTVPLRLSSVTYSFRLLSSPSVRWT